MIDIRLADPAAPDLRPLLEAHLAYSTAHSPDGSDHALDPMAMRQAGLQFWAIYESDRPVGCGALMRFGDSSEEIRKAEVKSVHVLEEMRGLGIARRLMEHLTAEAIADGCDELLLETGSELCPGFDGARALYESLGYLYCAPFGDYVEDPASVFMRLPLDNKLRTHPTKAA